MTAVMQGVIEVMSPEKWQKTAIFPFSGVSRLFGV